jgi:hypothetical protein
MSADAISRSQFPEQLRAAVLSRRQETPVATQWSGKIRAWEQDQKAVKRG